MPISAGNFWVVLLLTIMFLGNTIYLIAITPASHLDLVEAFRYLLYFLGPLTYCLLSRKASDVFFRSSFYLTALHLVLAAYGQSILGFNFFTDDERLMFSFIDRSPGATANLLLYLIIFSSFNLPPFDVAVDQKPRVIFTLVILLLIMMTEARSYTVAALILSAPLIKDCLKLGLGAGLIVLSGLVCALFWVYPSVVAMFAKVFLSTDFSTGRINIWLAFVQDLRSREQTVAMFGDGLHRKAIQILDIGYNTSDLHNHFLDPVNYYGLAFPCVFFIWYCSRSGFLKNRAATLLLAAMVPVLLTTSVFKYSFAVYVSTLLMIMPLYIADRPTKVGENIVEIQD
jgi:hypothetical protein